MERPAESIDTPHGKLYKPAHWGIQVPLIFGAFLGSLGLAEIICRFLGDLSTAAEIGIYLTFLGVLFAGYGFWTARLSAIAFEGIGRGILKTLFRLLILHKKPERLEDIIPSKEKLLEMAVRAQKAAWSFVSAGIIVAIPAGLVALLIDSDASTFNRLILISGGAIAWGSLLGFLGRRGFLPLPEGE